jgi:glycosyltransferase involved in cell wall biosynthesis
MKGPLVSILMTAYNREKYIGAAIESVLASTYGNFELIVVDDCSKDSTVEIVKRYAQQDGRIRLFENERNLGQFANRNLAAQYATGDYLKYLDSDDLMYPTGLEVLVQMMEQFPQAGYGLCSLDQDDERIFPYMLDPAAAYEKHFFQRFHLFYKAPLSSIIRKDVFFKVGGFGNPNGEGDYEMWLQLSTKSPVVLMPHGIVWYRVHDEQIDFKRRSDPFLDFRYFLVTLRYLGEGCPMDPRKSRAIAVQTKQSMARNIWRSFFIHSPAKAIQMFKAANFSLSELVKLTFRGILTKLHVK